MVHTQDEISLAVHRPAAIFALAAQIIAAGLDVLRRTTERDKDGVGILGLVFGDEMIIAAREVAKFFISLFEKLENRLVEIVAAGHHAVHVMLLVLDRAQQDGILEIHHLGHAASFR